MVPKVSLDKKISRNKILYMAIPLFMLLVVFYVMGSTQGFGNSNATTSTQQSVSTTQSGSESLYSNSQGSFASTQPTATPEKAKAEPGFGFDTVVDIFVKLAIVVGLIFLTTKVLRYLNKNSRAGSAEKLINVLETRSLAQNQVLYLVEVGGKAVLVGSTGSQLSTLTEITDATTISSMKTQVETQEAPKESFARYLQGFSSRLQANIQSNDTKETTEILAVGRLQEATSIVRRLTNEARQSAWNTGKKPTPTMASTEDHSAAVR
jgi:flagellar biogenesis protein FliO